MSYSSEVLADSPALYARLGEATLPAVAATSASSAFSGSFTAAQAFDGLPSTSWTTNATTTGWLRIQYATAYVATRYSMIGRREATPTRSPSAWTFEGSNDGSSWTTLDTQSGITWSANETKLFSFANATAYTYYRLNVTANSGDATYLNVTELIVAGATDSSAGGRLGCVTGTPTFGAPGALFGSSDTAITFSGVAQDVWFPWWSALDTGTFTLEAWVKTTGSSVAILGRDGAASVPYSLFVNASGALQLVIRTSGSSGANYDGTAVVNDGNWHHVVGVRDAATAEAWLYVDGVQDAHFTSTGVPQTAAGTGFRIASRGNAYLAGTIDEPALYTTALSSTRISVHYAAGTTPATTSGTLSADIPHPLTVSITGSYTPPTLSGILDATLPGPLAASLTGSYQAPPQGTLSVTLPKVTADLSGTYAPPVTPTGTLDAVLPFPTVEFTGTYTPPLLTGTLDATLPALTADLLGTYSGVGEAGTLSVVLPVLSVVLTGIYDGPIPTDTSNSMNGRTRSGRATVTITRPVAATPPGVTFGERYDKAIALPVPDMVEGRPT